MFGCESKPLLIMMFLCCDTHIDTCDIEFIHTTAHYSCSWNRLLKQRLFATVSKLFILSSVRLSIWMWFKVIAYRHMIIVRCGCACKQTSSSDFCSVEREFWTPLFSQTYVGHTRILSTNTCINILNQKNNPR